MPATSKEAKERAKERGRERTYAWRRANPERNREQGNARYWANPEKFRERAREWLRKKRLQKLGFTEAEYEGMLLKQEGKCAICFTDTPNGQGIMFHVDHDHETGKVRGLLCNNCNTALGHAKDSIEILKSMIHYLTKEE